MKPALPAGGIDADDLRLAVLVQVADCAPGRCVAAVRDQGAVRFECAPTVRDLELAVAVQIGNRWRRDARERVLQRAVLAVQDPTFDHDFDRAVPLEVGWSRIGRSSSADIRLDDPTVSRRHAVVVRTPGEDLRVLDDRSMNGITVNGEAVDWSPLVDGDELQVGRYTLHVIETAGVKAD